MTTKTVNVSEIVPAKFNPERRTASGLKALRDSIEKYGRTLVPLLVDSQMNLIDGHRRLACLKELGIQTAEVSIVEGDTTSQVWTEINSTTRKIGAADWASAYVQGMSLDDMPAGIAKAIYETERLVGREKYIELTNTTGRGGLYYVARDVAIYVDDRSDRFMKAAILYMDKRGNQYLMRKAMHSNVDPKELRRKIMSNRPLELKFA